jgi:hypothetical protein
LRGRFAEAMSHRAGARFTVRHAEQNEQEKINHEDTKGTKDFTKKKIMSYRWDGSVSTKIG